MWQRTFITAFFLLPLLLGAQKNILSIYSQGKYNDCLANCKEQLEVNPKDSMALYIQGLCLIQAQNYKPALKSLEAAAENNFQPSANVQMQQARCLAQLGKQEEALDLLGKLVKEGFSSYQAFEQEQFEVFSHQEHFQSLKDSVHRRAFPCFYDPNYTHFDFWLGEWDVFVGDIKVGKNSITKQEGGCSVLEQYSTARDYVGQSLNFYDPSDGLWKQFWSDNTQGLTKYIETERRPGYLQFISEPSSIPASNGTLRMTFTLQEDGSVRQFIEQKQTPESEWQSAFDGRYVKRENKN